MKLISHFLIIIIIGLSCSLAQAATIEVKTAADNTTTNGNCSLREAIQNANDDAATFSDCSAGSGADTITFNGVSSLTLTNEIFVNTDILIQGTVTNFRGQFNKAF